MTTNPEIRICQWCDEPIADGDAIDRFYIAQLHAECAFRSVMGSVSHIEARCSCFVPGADETDPPEMTRREAAKAALAAWKEQGNELPRE